jgi:methionyl-tRNA formyltransferase
MAKTKVIFMGTPDFAVPALQALIDDDYDIVAVYCQMPRKSGRGQQVHRSPVHRLAENQEIPVLTPPNFKKPHDREAFAAFEADIAIVAAYGLLLPREILDAPVKGCLNIHASILPRWRGAAPIHRALMTGDEKTGVCLMQMEAGLDTGPVFASQEIPIDRTATTGLLHDQLAKMGAELLQDKLPDILTGEIRAKPQAGQTTYASKVDKSETQLDWEMPAEMIDRQIRGLSPFPGAWFDVNGQRIKVLESEVVPDTSGTPGTTLDDALLIACGRGAVRLLKLQRAGKGPMAAGDFLRGFKLVAGTQLYMRP